LKEQLMTVLDTLTPREKKVLELRFGIIDGRTGRLRKWERSSTSPASVSARSRPRRSASSANPAAAKNFGIFSADVKN
jgi:hypothetical protein